MAHKCTTKCQANVRDNPNAPYSELHKYHGAYCECGGFYAAYSPYGCPDIEHEISYCFNTPMEKRWNCLTDGSKNLQRDKWNRETYKIEGIILGPLFWDREDEEINRHENQ